MRKRMMAFLAIGIFGVLLGIMMLAYIAYHPAVVSIAPRIVTVVMTAMSAAWIGVVISTRGGTRIRDEMVTRIESVSGKYSFDASLLFILALGVLNLFYPLPLSISGLLFTVLMFMSVSFTLIRYFLMRRGKAE